MGLKMSKSKITFLIAPPCHGKTTYRNKHLSDDFVISRDDIREKYIKKFGLEYKDLFTPKGISKKIDNINEEILLDYSNSIKIAKDMIKNGKDIIIDLANLMTIEDRNNIWNEIVDQKDNVLKSFVVLSCKNHLVKQINTKRANETGKFIPYGIILKMKDQLQNPHPSESVDFIKNIDISKSVKQKLKKSQIKL